MSEGAHREDLPDIEAMLPHRPPMLHVDAVLEVVPGDHIVALKEVGPDEPSLAGHFPPPGRPVFPGVLIVEALAQAGAILVHRTESFDPSRRPLMLLGIDRARFRRPVVPGDALRLEVSIAARRDDAWRLRARALVDGELAADATILAALGEPR